MSNQLSIRDVIYTLRIHNQWRRGKKLLPGNKVPSAALIGRTIDQAVEYLKELETKQ